MSLAAIRDSLILDKKSLTKIYNKAMKNRNELVHQKVNKKFIPKVCCCCNRFIMHGNEKFLPISYLKHTNVQNCLQMDADDWAIFEVDENVQDVINAQYTQKCISSYKNLRVYKILEPLMLSPETYYIEKKKKGQNLKEINLGCCKECFDQLKKVYDGKNNDKPKYTIANNKYFGYPPVTSY